MSDTARSWLRSWAGLFLLVLLCEAVGLLAGLATQSSVNTWYPTLEKPFFTPPDRLFAPVWTVLYALMGIAAWFVVRRDWARPRVRTALGLFAGQLVLNGAWSFVFFGARSIVGGLVVIGGLWLVLAVTTQRFFTLSRVAGWLLVPYLLWVTYAGALNAGIWWLN